MNIIKKSYVYSNSIKFELNDNIDTIDNSCKSRLNFFYLESSNKYNNILYLDIDILIKGDINKVFNLLVNDIIYVLEEGNLNRIIEYDPWGRNLFNKEELANYTDTSAFTSGILLFKNSENIKMLFNSILNHMISNNHKGFHDQPYIVYNAFKFNMFNNKVLKDYVVNNDNNIYSNKIIHHFPGGPGIHEKKIYSMTIFLNSIKKYTFENKIYNGVNIELLKIFLNVV